MISCRESTCGDCGEQLGHHAWITLNRDKGALCLACADLDQLVFLSSGAAALTRRARKHSALSAVVLKWSRAGREWEIAEHACLKYSGRVGRAAFAKKLHEEAVRLAVIAHKWFFGTRFRRQAYAWHSSSLAVQS